MLSPGLVKRQTTAGAVFDARSVVRGQRWIFSAGFNVTDGLVEMSRVDSELADLTSLAEAGARVSVLSHRGMREDGGHLGLQDVAEYLSRRLGRAVRYLPECTGGAAVRASHTQQPGGVSLYGNTRQHEGELTNSPATARAFAELGDAVVVGGFSKAYRHHASNVGILSFLPGYAASSLATEVSRLEPWVSPGRAARTVAVLGGSKPEKTDVGLPYALREYDVVVPGGVVLNNILRQRGVEVGASSRGAEPTGAALASTVRTGSRPRLHLPTRVVITHGHCQVCARTVEVSDGVPPGWRIVDFHHEPWLRAELAQLARDGGSVLIAGTPSLHARGFGEATEPFLRIIASDAVRAILLGGDTVAECDYAGETSAGGGSALHYLLHGDLPVLSALRRSSQAVSESGEL